VTFHYITIQRPNIVFRTILCGRISTYDECNV